MQKITPFLWYAKEAEDAAAFYTSIFPDSRIGRVVAMPSESPSGPPPTVLVTMMADSDRTKAKRETDAMLAMVKIDVAKLVAAFEGRG